MGAAALSGVLMALAAGSLARFIMRQAGRGKKLSRPLRRSIGVFLKTATIFLPFLLPMLRRGRHGQNVAVQPATPQVRVVS
jgi:hypothetical protein